MQRLRDNPDCAQQEYDRILDAADPGLQRELTFDPAEDVAAPFIAGPARPRIAILREQGVNGQMEMAAAFDRAGFEAVDVHMSDIISGRVTLADFTGFAACGGFSYGDVLGAGEGWAKSILFNARARDAVRGVSSSASDIFALGVCNGCQMMSNLHELIPGTGHWPHFVRNRSEQFEARVAMVEVLRSAIAVLRGHGGQPHADRGRARRRLCGVPRCGVSWRRRATRRAALRRQPRCGDRTLSAAIRTARRRASRA